VCRSCKKLPKALKDWQAFIDLKQKIDDFSECCPLLEMMANKSMKIRHWDRIASVTGYTFEIESESFLLRHVMEAPLLKCKDDIEVMLATSPPMYCDRSSSIVISGSVCLFVCVLAYLTNHMSFFMKVSIHVNCSRVSVLL